MLDTRSEYYLPATWDDFIGNHAAIAHFKNLVRLIRVEHKVRKADTMLRQSHSKPWNDCCT